MNDDNWRCLIFTLWGFSLILSLVLTVVGGWAIIQLVTHFT